MNNQPVQAQLEAAIIELFDFLKDFRHGEETPARLEQRVIPVGGLSIADVMPPAEPSEDESAVAWTLGIAGHGLQNLWLCCRWQSPKQRFAILLPYGRVLEDDETQARQRSTIQLACSAALLLLDAEQQGFCRDLQHPDALLLAVWDDAHAEFRLVAGGEVIRQGDSWMPLVDGQGDGAAAPGSVN